MTKVTKIMDVGDFVCCDLCNKDYTHSDEKGGFVFAGKGVGPCCAVRFMSSIEEYNEQEYITARCRPTQPFKDFIMEYRGGDNTIRITEL